jgi:hypothetical protein
MMKDSDGNFTVTTEGEVSTQSVEDVANREMEIARQSEVAEFQRVTKEVLQSRMDNQAEDEEEENSDTAPSTTAITATRRGNTVTELEEDEQEDVGSYLRGDDRQYASDGEFNEDARSGYWSGRASKITSFWKHFITNSNGKMPNHNDVAQINKFSMMTGDTPSLTAFSMYNAHEYSDEDSDDDEKEGMHRRYFNSQAYKERRVRDESCPTGGMLRSNPELAEEWKPSMVKEFSGMKLITHVVTKEHALEVGVTPKVTDRSTKRDGSKKTRIAINGAQEFRNGVFPNKEVLHSPAMDAELFKLIIQVAVQFDLKLASRDVTQCFTHNSMSDARFPREIISYFDEYECGTPGGEYRSFEAISYGAADASSEWYR